MVIKRIYASNRSMKAASREVYLPIIPLLMAFSLFNVRTLLLYASPFYMTLTTLPLLVISALRKLTGDVV